MVSENINLTDKQAEFIRRSIEAGEFEDVSEVVRAGIHLLEEWQAERLKREAELGAMLDEAKASGLSDRTPEAVWAASEARYRRDDA